MSGAGASFSEQRWRRRESNPGDEAPTCAKLRESVENEASENGELFRRLPQLSAHDDARHQIARRYLEAVARGESPSELALALAGAVLAAPDAQLALDVLRGGEHMQMRAVQLAERVLREHDVPAARRTGAS